MTLFGTRRRSSGKFLTLALHTIVMQKPLIELADRPRTRKKGSGQIELFALDIKQREEYHKFAKTLRYFMQSNLKTLNNIHDHYEQNKDLDYNEYEFYGFWEHFKDEELKFAAEQLERLAGGATLTNYEPLIKFLSNVNGWALHAHQNERGGCF